MFHQTFNINENNFNNVKCGTAVSESELLCESVTNRRSNNSEIKTCRWAWPAVGVSKGGAWAGPGKHVESFLFCFPFQLYLRNGVSDETLRTYLLALIFFVDRIVSFHFVFF